MNDALTSRTKPADDDQQLVELFSARLEAGHQGAYMPPSEPQLKVRTLFLSDMHFGMPGTATREFIDFMEQVAFERLVLVGDVVDGWALTRRWNWGERQERCLDLILGAAQNADEVLYIPGNHDEFWRASMPSAPLGGIKFALNHRYGLADGRQVWITHGDEHDPVTSRATWLSQFGSVLYEGGIQTSKGFKRAQQYVGLPGFSPSRQLKDIVKRVVQPSRQFHAQLSQDANDNQCEVVLCGHIHRPELCRTEDAVIYANCGDWVETASAIAENADGTLSLLRWSHGRGLSTLAAEPF